MWTWPPSCLLHNGCTKIIWMVTEGVTNNCERDSETFCANLKSGQLLVETESNCSNTAGQWKTVREMSRLKVSQTLVTGRKQTKTLWLFVTSLHKYYRSHFSLEKSQLCNISFPHFCKLFGIQLEPFELSPVLSEEGKNALPRECSQKTTFIQSFGRHWVPFCSRFIAIMACKGRESLR